VFGRFLFKQYSFLSPLPHSEEVARILPSLITSAQPFRLGLVIPRAGVVDDPSSSLPLPTVSFFFCGGYCSFPCIKRNQPLFQLPIWPRLVFYFASLSMTSCKRKCLWPHLDSDSSAAVRFWPRQFSRTCPNSLVAFLVPPVRPSPEPSPYRFRVSSAPFFPIFNSRNRGALPAESPLFFRPVVSH